MSSRMNCSLGIIALYIVTLAGCSGKGGEKHSGEHAHDEAEGAGGAEDHESHDHGHGETSDLDRPVGELFADTCEHDLKTHECDECRYEVGVVKAPANLFEGGLLQKTTAEKRAIASPLRLTGAVQFDERLVAHVSTQAEGIIRRVHVTLGDSVKRGQALVEIDSMAVGEARAEHLEAQGMFRLAKRNHDRLVALREEGISSEKEMLRAEQEMDAAQIRVEAALGKLTRLGMSAAAARALTQKRSTGRLVLRSPADGMVLKMHAVAGEVAKSEESLFTVGNNVSLWVWADLYERDLSLVSTAQAREPLAARVRVKAFPGQPFSGIVDFISPSMNESSRTVKLRIAVPNPDGRLLAGMFAEVEISLPGDQQALTVPKAAVLADEGRSFVFVHHEGDYFVRREVACGRSLGEWTEIKHGLDGGETVVADGSFLMKSDVLRSKMGAGCAD